MKKRVVQFLLLAMAVSMLGGCGKEKNYECTVELGENYVFDAAEIFGVSEKEAENYVANLSTLDTTKAGNYEVKVKNGEKEYTVKYTVEDTKEPIVILKSNVLFTKNIDNPDYTGIVEVRDGSEYTLKLCKFKKLEDIRVVSESVLAYHTGQITTQSTEELLQRTDELPDGEGIYSAVLVVEDAYRHKVAKEVVVIYDTNQPVVSGIEELQTEITVDDLSVEWKDNLLGYLSITDNVDGIITSSMMDVEMKPLKNDNTEYEVDASYTDRAGNQMSVGYTIKLKEKEQAPPPSTDGNTDGGTSNNGGSNIGGGNNNTESNTGDVGNTGNDSQSGNPKPSVSNPGYSYEDRDGDGYADLAKRTEMNGYIVELEDVPPLFAKFQLALAEAGMYNIVYSEWDGGSYGVLVPSVEVSDKGFGLLKEYLASMGLGWSSMDGSWFDINCTAYQCIVYGSATFEQPQQEPFDPDVPPEGVLEEVPSEEEIPDGVLNEE